MLCDIRDRAALRDTFAKHAPEVVFHAAALKHLPMLERFPEEGWKTNVLGSLHVRDCAAEAGLLHFVNISTDKAADATSVLGQTKRLAERLTAWYAAQTGLGYLSVRFGNVLGSRGSLLDTFRAQIDRGGPVTVTDPDVSRFFMTIPESCELVLQAAAIGDPGDVLVLDMGEPVRIIDVARRLIEESGKRVEVEYTGLREGEKLHEFLLSESERGRDTAHPLITQVSVPQVEPRDVLADDVDLEAMRGDIPIRDTIEALAGEVTVVIIAHRMSTIDMCDRIMVVEDGRVTALGTPAELQSTSRFYQRALATAGLGSTGLAGSSGVGAVDEPGTQAR